LVDESLNSFALAVGAAGAGSGGVTSSPAGIACGATCQASFTSRKLVCSRGTWAGSPSRYAFTWLRSGKAVGHGARYVVRTGDRGHVVRCVVTARNANGASTAASGTLRVPR
ncbi:MAG: hypothetical protein QOE87_4453, partial [Gaiellales bacterium]|nr:hypothetical protein [Gaiellales bacterium]